MDDDFGDESSTIIEEDYYTFLNVPKNSNLPSGQACGRCTKEIEAEALFNRLKTAYEVLSDPHKRAIYDSLGVRGLETDGWELTLRQKTPAEIREEYERLEKEREARALQQKTNPRGNVTVMINATEILSPYYDEFDEKIIPSVEVSGISMTQSIDAPLTLRDTVTLSGSLSSQKGIGNGAFTVSGRRLLNKGWVAVDLTAGNGPAVGVKGSRTLSQKVFANFGGSLNLRSNVLVPAFMSCMYPSSFNLLFKGLSIKFRIFPTALACQLSKHTVGYLTYNIGGSARSMSTVVEQNTEKHQFQLTLLVGIPHCYVSAAYTRKLLEQELKLRVATKVGTFGVLAEYGAEKKISKYSSVVATVSVGVPTGVTLKIKYIRSTQTFIFPIHLSEEIIPAAVFYATVTPLCIFFVVKKLPKEEAESSIDLMSATFARIREDESKTKGLIIDVATYGKADSTDEERFDVTIPLQCLVRNSQLNLHATPKSELPGFYDPCVGEDKTLRVQFTYREKNHSMEINDKEPLQLPGLLGK
uniref:J domain-containing protein n=1 Tax=Lutzomyia longipalpis TaxID=7200 RepID=A0A1B0CWR7_LUTLO